MPTAFSAPSDEEWRKYEHRSMAKQQEFMEKYEEEFVIVPITNSDRIQAGDHLVLERKYYDHHMLCTFSADNHVIVIHYSGPAWGISKTFSCISFKDVGVKGEVLEQMFSFEDLVKEKVSLPKSDMRINNFFCVKTLNKSQNATSVFGEISFALIWVQMPSDKPLD